LNVRRLNRTDHYPVESDENSAPESILDNENVLSWNGDLEIPNDSKDDSLAGFQSDIVLCSGIQYLEIPELQDVIAAPKVPGFIRLIQKS